MNENFKIGVASISLLSPSSSQSAGNKPESTSRFLYLVHVSSSGAQLRGFADRVYVQCCHFLFQTRLLLLERLLVWPCYPKQVGK
jgi:hypothetical protein